MSLVVIVLVTMCYSLPFQVQWGVKLDEIYRLPGSARSYLRTMLVLIYKHVTASFTRHIHEPSVLASIFVFCVLSYRHMHIVLRSPQTPNWPLYRWAVAHRHNARKNEWSLSQ